MTVLLTLIICAPITVACLCRLWMLNPKTDKSGWGVMYMLMLAFSLSVFAETANTGKWPDFVTLTALTAIGFNLWLTHKQWIDNNTPPIVRK